MTWKLFVHWLRNPNRAALASPEMIIRRQPGYARLVQSQPKAMVETKALAVHQKTAERWRGATSTGVDATAHASSAAEGT